MHLICMHSSWLNSKLFVSLQVINNPYQLSKGNLQCHLLRLLCLVILVIPMDKNFRRMKLRWK
jgi:hypothetical protein